MQSAHVTHSWLLISTCQSLLLVEPETGSGFRLDGGRGIYYGITEFDGSICVAVRRRIEVSVDSGSCPAGQIFVFNKDYQLTKTLEPPFPMRDIHQILGYDGQLWVTCTFDNMVAMYDGTSWEQWYPKGMAHPTPKDINHFNSLSMIDGKLCLVSNNHSESEILVFDLPARSLSGAVPLGIKAHNVWKCGNQWMTCSSGEGRIVGSEGFSRNTGGFPRGISFINNNAYVGVSDVAERALRGSSKGYVQIYDPDWLHLGTIDLVHEGGISDLMPVALGNSRLPASSRSVQFPLKWHIKP